MNRWFRITVLPAVLAAMGVVVGAAPSRAQDDEGCARTNMLGELQGAVAEASQVAAEQAKPDLPLHLSYERAKLNELASEYRLTQEQYDEIAWLVLTDDLTRELLHDKVLPARRKAKDLFIDQMIRERRKLDRPQYTPLWERFYQDLYAGEPAAIRAYYGALQRAEDQGLGNNPLFGGERLRVAQQLVEGRKRAHGDSLKGDDGKYLAPKINSVRNVRGENWMFESSSGPDGLETYEAVGIAKWWTRLPKRHREYLNQILGQREGVTNDPADFDLAKTQKKLLLRLADREIQHEKKQEDFLFDFFNDVDREFAGIIQGMHPDGRNMLREIDDSYSERTLAAMAFRYYTLDPKLKKAIRGKVSWARNGKDAARILYRELLSNGPSDFRDMYLQQQFLDRERPSLYSYMETLESGIYPQQRQEELEHRRAGDRARTRQSIRTSIPDEGRPLETEYFDKRWEIWNRSELESSLVMGKGVVLGAKDTVVGIITAPYVIGKGLWDGSLIEGLDHLRRNPHKILVMMDDALMDGDEVTGRFMFEVLLTAATAGVGPEASAGTKALKVADYAEDAADAGKFAAALRIADDLEELAQASRKLASLGKITPGDLDDIENAARIARRAAELAEEVEDASTALELARRLEKVGKAGEARELLDNAGKGIARLRGAVDEADDAKDLARLLDRATDTERVLGEALDALGGPVDDVAKSLDDLILDPASDAARLAGERLWGKSADEIAEALERGGYKVTIEQGTKGSRRSVQLRVEGHPTISNIQVHPGGGRHGGAYYKISTSTKGKLKIVDPTTYKATAGEKVRIIEVVPKEGVKVPAGFAAAVPESADDVARLTEKLADLTSKPPYVGEAFAKPEHVYRGFSGEVFTEKSVLRALAHPEEGGLWSRRVSEVFDDLAAGNEALPAAQRASRSDLVRQAERQVAKEVMEEIEEGGLVRYVMRQQKQTHRANTVAESKGSTGLAFTSDRALARGYAGMADDIPDGRPLFVVKAEGQHPNLVQFKSGEYYTPGHMPAEQLDGVFVGWEGSSKWYYVSKTDDGLDVFRVTEVANPTGRNYPDLQVGERIGADALRGTAEGDRLADALAEALK